MPAAAIATTCVAVCAVFANIADAVRTMQRKVDQLSQSDEANERAAFSGRVGDHFHGINGSITHNFVGFPPNSKLFSNPFIRDVASTPPTVPIPSTPPIPPKPRTPSTRSTHDESYEGGTSQTVDEYDYQDDEFTDAISQSLHENSLSVPHSFEKGSDTFVMLQPKKVLKKVSAIRASISSFKANLGELEELLMLIEGVNRLGGEDSQYSEDDEYTEESFVAKKGNKAKGQDLQYEEKIIPSKKHKEKKHRQISEVEEDEDVSEYYVDERASVTKHKVQLKGTRGSDVEDEERDFSREDPPKKKPTQKNRKLFEMDAAKKVPGLRKNRKDEPGYKADEDSEVGEEEVQGKTKKQKAKKSAVRKDERVSVKKHKQQGKKPKGSEVEDEEEIGFKTGRAKQNPKMFEVDEEADVLMERKKTSKQNVVEEDEEAENEVPLMNKKQKRTGTRGIDDEGDVSEEKKKAFKKVLERASKAYKALHEVLLK